MITPEQLQKWRELAEKATPGPWEVWTSNSQRRITAHRQQDGGVLSGYRHPSDGVCDLIGNNRENDLAFIAAARSAVPQLVAEVERLRAAVRIVANDGGEPRVLFMTGREFAALKTWREEVAAKPRPTDAEVTLALFVDNAAIDAALAAEAQEGK